MMSHILSENGPYPPAIPPLEVTSYLDIAHGGGNVFSAKMTSHSGTHIDAQAHVKVGGKPVTEFPIRQFVYEKPYVADIPMNDRELFTPEHFYPHAEQMKKCDLLLIRTGHQKYRNSDPSRYIMDNPGFSIKCAKYLHDNFPDMKTLALDTPSFSAMSLLDEGMPAHLTYIGERCGFIIEDVNMDFDLSGLKRVFVAPWFMQGLDSAPCTIIGEVE
jgi:kynurenine formamidase